MPAVDPPPAPFAPDAALVDGFRAAGGDAALPSAGEALAGALPLPALRAGAAGGPFPPPALRASDPFAGVALCVTPASSFSDAGFVSGPPEPFVAAPLPLAVCAFAALAGALLFALDFEGAEPAPGPTAPFAAPPEAA